jgi:leucyl-tRNA synthetase
MVTFAVLDNDNTHTPESLSQKRNRLYAQFVSRATQSQIIAADITTLSRQLNHLVENGHVYFTQTADGVFEAFYGPSCEASVCVSNTIPYWPDNLAAKIKKTARQSSGALCTLQVENHSETIDVFVTDWSSCTAACAVAVHKYHPFARNLEQATTAENYFTGHYVRHPLTADLMSVWVADWVKPDFGTGAVLVNPAHNLTDLEFARRVGLPIRFALSLDPSADETALPQAPLLKTGYAVRAGFLDGKQAQVVHNETVNVLLRKGVARLHEDKRIPGEVIARISIGQSQDACEPGLYWNKQQGTLSLDAHQGVAVNVEFLPCFAAAVTTVQEKPRHLQVNAAEYKKRIGVLGALIYDLGGKQAFTPLTLLESVEYAGAQQDTEALELALLVGEAPEKVLVIRKALIDQVESFLRSTRQLCTRLDQGGAVPPATIMDYLHRGDPVSAFKGLHQWQKSVASNDETICANGYPKLLKILGVAH